jgi:hypothetical protein
MRSKHKLIQESLLATVIPGIVTASAKFHRRSERTRMNSNDLGQLLPHMHPFPEIDAVFVGDLRQYQRHFLPLISLNASAIDLSWTGALHIVSPKETYDGAVGEHCSEYHTNLCRNNQIAFKVDADSRYTFLADFRFFFIERGAKQGTYASQAFLDEFLEHYENVQASFDQTKEFYQRTGYLNRNGQRQPDRKDRWLETDKLHHSPTVHVPDLHLPNGNRFRFVARCTGHSYFESGADSISLYFDPIDRIAIIHFLYT